MMQKFSAIMWLLLLACPFNIALVHINWGISGDTDFDATRHSPRQGIFTWGR